MPAPKWGWGLKNKTLGVSFALALFAAPSLFAQQVLEAYGDSITAGFMSRTDVTHAPPLKEMGSIISDLAMFIMTKDPAHVAKHHAPELAWPTLLAKRLDPTGPMKLNNQAISGAHGFEILGQVKNVKATAEVTKAFFFIGHNDLCNNVDSPENIGAAFKDEVGRAIEEWDRRHKDSVAYLIPVGQIHRVYQTLFNYVWHRGPQNNYSCVDSWTKFFPYCPSHYKKAKAGTFEAYMGPRLDAMNDGLDELASELSKKSASNRFHYLKDAHDVSYDPDLFAVDCFHLSAKGQKTIADRLEQMIAQVP